MMNFFALYATKMHTERNEMVLLTDVVSCHFMAQIGKRVR